MFKWMFERRPFPPPDERDVILKCADGEYLVRTAKHLAGDWYCFEYPSLREGGVRLIGDGTIDGQDWPHRKLVSWKWADA